VDGRLMGRHRGSRIDDPFAVGRTLALSSLAVIGIDFPQSRVSNRFPDSLEINSTSARLEPR